MSDAGPKKGEVTTFKLVPEMTRALDAVKHRDGCTKDAAIRRMIQLGLQVDMEMQALIAPTAKRQALRELRRVQHDIDVGTITLDGDYVKIPLYEVRVAAGSGAIVEGERVIEDIVFRHDWIKTKLRANIKDLGCLSVTGHSMEPTICEGDLIMFDRAQHMPKHDQIVVLREGGEPIVKRLCIKGSASVEIHSDNPDSRYKREPVKKDELDIIGRVVWVAGKRS